MTLYISFLLLVISFFSISIPSPSHSFTPTAYSFFLSFIVFSVFFFKLRQCLRLLISKANWKYKWLFTVREWPGKVAREERTGERAEERILRLHEPSESESRGGGGTLLRIKLVFAPDN